jgi:two-component system, NarL family, nitrate/nitrite response regulator NarL
MPTDPISILIADGDAAFRVGIRRALETEGFDVVGEADNAASTVSATVQARPDVCLVEVAMPGNGLNAVAAIARQCPATTIVALTGSPDPVELLEALERGASGYLQKTVATEQLVKTLRATRLGEPALARALLPALMQQVRSRPERRIQMQEGPVELTAREWEVSMLLRNGFTTREIAVRLGLSPVTVRRHVSSVLKKLGARDRQAAVRVLTLSDR